MKHVLFLIVGLLAVGSALVLVVNQGITGFASQESEFDYTWTKAICEGNTCRDYEITCKDGEAIEINPVSGFVVFDPDWEDLREDTELCG